MERHITRAAITRIIKILSYLTDKEQTQTEIWNKVKSEASNDENKLSETSKSTIGRDFKVLAELTDFVQVNKDKKPYTYKLGNYFLIKGSDNAVAMVLIETFIKNLLPISTYKNLKPYFSKSKELLHINKKKYGREKLLSKWPKKVAIINRGVKFIKPEYDKYVLEAMLQALYNEKKVTIIYQPNNQRTRTYTVSVLGLVLKNEITYFVVSCDEWQDGESVRHFPVHRIKSVEGAAGISKPPQGYSLFDYIKSNVNFGFPISEPEVIEFEGYFSNEIENDMKELKLSDDQTITRLDKNRFHLTASVQNNYQFYWWLLGLGSLVEVVKPVKLRNKIMSEIKQMSNIYNI